jgi:hypothetical protein
LTACRNSAKASEASLRKRGTNSAIISRASSFDSSLSLAPPRTLGEFQRRTIDCSGMGMRGLSLFKGSRHQPRHDSLGWKLSVSLTGNQTINKPLSSGLLKVGTNTLTLTAEAEIEDEDGSGGSAFDASKMIIAAGSGAAETCQGQLRKRFSDGTAALPSAGICCATSPSPLVMRVAQPNTLPSRLTSPRATFRPPPSLSASPMPSLPTLRTTKASRPASHALADLLTQFSEYEHEYRLLHEFLTINTDYYTNFWRLIKDSRLTADSWSESGMYTCAKKSVRAVDTEL